MIDEPKTDIELLNAQGWIENEDGTWHAPGVVGSQLSFRSAVAFAKGDYPDLRAIWGLKEVQQ